MPLRCKSLNLFVLEPKSLVSFPSGIISPAMELISTLLVPAPIRVLTSAPVIPLPRVGTVPLLSIAGLKPVPDFQALSAEM